MSKSVLIIDDDPEFRFIAARILINIGLEVTEVDGLKSAQEALNDKIPNLIILDLNLVEESGLTFLEQSANDKRLKRVPIIVCSAQSLKKIIYKVYSLGVSEFMAKPIKSTTLVQKVKKLLRDSPPLEVSFKDESQKPTIKVRFDGELTKLSDLGLVTQSPCKFSQGVLSEIQVELFKKKKINCKKIESSTVSVSREPGVYETQFTLIGLSESDAEKIRALKNQWKLA